MTLGQNIQAARREKGLSQEALAEKIGVSRQALGKWEKDTSLPGLDNLQALSEALGVGVDTLLGRTPAEAGSAPALTLDDMRTLLDARDAAHRRRELAGLAVLAVLAATVLGIFWHNTAQYNARLDRTASTLSQLQGKLDAVQALPEQIEDLKAAMQQGESTVAAWGWLPAGKLHKDLDGWWMPAQIQVTPKRLTPGMTARLVCVWGDAVESNPMEDRNGSFALLMNLKEGYQYDLSVQWVDAQGAVTTEALGSIPFYESDITPKLSWICDDMLLDCVYDREGDCIRLVDLSYGVDLWLPEWLTVREGGLELRIDGEVVETAPLEKRPYSEYWANFAPDTLHPAGADSSIEVAAYLIDDQGSRWDLEPLPLHKR